MAIQKWNKIPIGGGVAQNGPEYPVGPVASVIVVPLRKGRETGGYRIERGDPAGMFIYFRLFILLSM